MKNLIVILTMLILFISCTDQQGSLSYNQTLVNDSLKNEIQILKEKQETDSLLQVIKELNFQNDSLRKVTKVEPVYVDQEMKNLFNEADKKLDKSINEAYRKKNQKDQDKEDIKKRVIEELNK